MKEEIKKLFADLRIRIVEIYKFRNDSRLMFVAGWYMMDKEPLLDIITHSKFRNLSIQQETKMFVFEFDEDVDFVDGKLKFLFDREETPNEPYREIFWEELQNYGYYRGNYPQKPIM